MIIDTSAVLSILLQEPDARLYSKVISSAAHRRMSSTSFLEAAIVIDRAKQPVSSRQLDELISEARIVVEPFTFEQAKIAREAYRDFGKGSGHPAGLNFGDCFAYALAKATGEPLLFKGDDFTHTDVKKALVK